jgi:anti-sigma-K factor RskA
MARDPAFAALVEAWRERLAPMIDEAEPVSPSAELWPGIERALPANENRRALRIWRFATLGASALAAASLAVAVVIANRPTPAPQAILNASLTDPSNGRPLFVAAYDPARKVLIVTSLLPPGTDPRHVHELWLIPADGRPRPLGFIAPGAARSAPMPQPLLPLVQPGASIAVSVEPPGGSTRTDGPSGPIAAAGKLARL